MVELSIDQKTVLDAIVAWYREPKRHKQYITLGGYAGTGKTTLIAYLRKVLRDLDSTQKVGFASYTGKAARVLRHGLSEGNAIYDKDTVGTIHSLIYSPIVNEKEEIVGWKTKEKLDRNLIIIDEASMVDEEIWTHLLSYGIPIIAVGDHGQLPPIKGNFNLMESPQLRLEKIHRQAELNPIIGLSIQARENGLVRRGRYSDTVIKYDRAEPDSQEAMQELMTRSDTDTLILCGYNQTRIKINNHIRQVMGFLSPSPLSGDRVICLRNNHRKNIFNGMTGTISSLEPQEEYWANAEINMDDEPSPYRGLISLRQFNSKTPLNFSDRRSVMQGDLFDFGYAVTVHKAQGSQAKRVVLFEERFPKMTDEDWRRWLYTAVTRAIEDLYIFGT